MTICCAESAVWKLGRLLICLGIFGATCSSTSSLWADDTATASAETDTPVSAAGSPGAKDEDAKVAATPEQDSAYTLNTLIMFISAVLVLLMQPGFAMLEVGLNSAKNTVNILFKNVMDLSVGMLLFFAIGFGLMYPGADYAGDWFGFGGVGIGGELGMETATQVDATAPYSPNVDFLFQVAFAATAATIVSGAVAGRMQFRSYLIYSAVLTGLIYPISGMWKWGGGWLAEMGFQDFAGSVVVHALGGFAGLAGAIVLGPRLGRFVKGKSIPMPGHNIAFAALGVFILWIGWYGFNCGSQLEYAGAVNANMTVYIAITTSLSAAAGAVAAMLVAWVLFRKPDVTMALNGCLAGLVGITAGCDQVPMWASLVIGLAAGALVVVGILALDKLCIDDPVGAWPVHGLCGVWGGIATGIFGTADGLSVSVQVLGTVAISVWAFVTMFALFWVLRAMGILRVSAAEESAGLDVSEHGMHAYPPHMITDDTYAPIPVSQSL